MGSLYRWMRQSLTARTGFPRWEQELVEGSRGTAVVWDLVSRLGRFNPASLTTCEYTTPSGNHVTVTGFFTPRH
jgi:hypothetical protein